MNCARMYGAESWFGNRVEWTGKQVLALGIPFIDKFGEIIVLYRDPTPDGYSAVKSKSLGKI